MQACFGSKDLLEGFSSLKDGKVLAEKFDATGMSNKLHMPSPSQLIQITPRRFGIRKDGRFYEEEFAVI